MSDALYSKCLLEGDELERAVERVLGLDDLDLRRVCAPSLEKLITDNQIFLNPPHEVHCNGGPNAGWTRYNCWTATVSSRVRGFTNKHGIKNCVGRGMGETPRIAVLRAIVASFGDET